MIILITTTLIVSNGYYRRYHCHQIYSWSCNASLQGAADDHLPHGGDLLASACSQEIVKIFVSLEQRNFSLLTYVNQQSFDCVLQCFPFMVFRV